MTVSIEVSNVTKTFRLATEPAHSIKERVLRGRRQKYRTFTALDDVSLDVEDGSTVGILGHNGSGKSTLLKCVAGTMNPSRGEIRLRGRVASLLELGAGFHPELTGRENVFVNASFLGIPKADIEARLDEIVEFAEISEFIDQQVKHYSSGMYVRLGFAVAVNVDPDVLLVDEVLAVGDEIFQAKCLDRIRQFQTEGRTILFVTHSADLVRSLCTKAVVLHHGKLVADAPPGEAIRVYREHLHGFVDDATLDELAPEHHDDRMWLTGVNFVHDGSGNFVEAGQSLQIRIGYESREPVPGSMISVEIHDPSGRQMIYGADADALDPTLGALVGTGEVVFDIEHVPLLDGRYPIVVHLKDRPNGRLIDFYESDQYAFEVMNPTRTAGLVHLAASVRLERSR
jgi:ABC-2 type transport system ATP-binding protein